MTIIMMHVDAFKDKYLGYFWQTLKGRLAGITFTIIYDCQLQYLHVNSLLHCACLSAPMGSKVSQQKLSVFLSSVTAETTAQYC